MQDDKTTGQFTAVHPDEIEKLSRRQVLKGGLSLTAYLSLGKLLFPQGALAATSYPLQRKLVWINMQGGWDILEVMDPKASTGSGTTIAYDYGLTNQVSGGDENTRLGRFLPNIAAVGSDLLLVRGLAMGTTSHNAGSIYMDTGVLSNTGRVNSASIPTIVASEGASTIPLLQLSGGSSPQTDRGLAKKAVSVVRADNLALYRQMFPDDTEETQRRLKILDYVNTSIDEVKAQVDASEGQTSDRILSFAAAEQKVRNQFNANVGQQLQLSRSDIAQFVEGGPRSLDQSAAQTFALALKMITSDICDCINLGIGGFDTHANQTTRLQPILQSTDFIIKRFVDALKSAGKLDNTLIVLYSDFGRTPGINGQNGRDHWPIGGALMIGGGIAGGRVVGGTDAGLHAQSIDFDSGMVSTNGNQLNPTHLGGSVLELTLGASYLQYRNYLSSVPALTRLK